MTDANTSALRANTKALTRLASAQEEIARQLKIGNMLAAANFSGNGWKTSTSYTKALHHEVINQIGVRPS